MNRYSAVLATGEHYPVTSVEQLKHCEGPMMGLFLDGVPIGHGYLERVSIGKKDKIVHTSGTKIFDKYRRKGHGIYLYINLVEKAREIGVTQIRCDYSLNRLSRKMWRDKLSKIYKVKVHRMKTPCRRCGHVGTQYYSIDLRDRV
jgi:hypothetical protein